MRPAVMVRPEGPVLDDPAGGVSRSSHVDLGAGESMPRCLRRVPNTRLGATTLGYRAAG
jgi:hypothetical protein